jgi:hypothetical protein
MKQFGFSSFADVRITSLDLNAQPKNDFFTASDRLQNICVDEEAGFQSECAP